MKGFPDIKKIVFSTALLAGIPAITIALLLPSIGSEYTLSIETPDKFMRSYVYSDLNSDSISELIYTAKGTPYFYIAVKDYNLRFYDQWNLQDSLNDNLSEIFFGNYDHDKFKEIYVFTHKRDSLFLNINEFIENQGTKLERIFITKIGYIKGEVTSVLYPIGFYDTDGDGADELYFGITTGFSPDPRRVYYYNIVHKTLVSSQYTGTICLFPKMIDVDGDKRPEIFGRLSASGNFGSKVPFSDSSTWFMVFNDKLKFKFPPEEFRGYVNSLEINTFNKDTGKLFILSHWAGGTDTTVLKSRVMIASPEGKLLKYRLFSDFGITRFQGLFVTHYDQSDKFCIISQNIIELDNNLDLIRKVDLPFHTSFTTYQTDLNSDNEDEFLFYSEDEEKIAVYSAGLTKLTTVNFKAPPGGWQFSDYLSPEHKHKLFLNTGNNGYFLSLGKNYFYFLGYLIYPGIYVFFFFFIVLIKRINTFQVVEKESLKHRLISLQLKGIKAQLDPHFTFNTLNSIASLIYLEDRQTAYDYMNKFTQLLRGMLNDAERIYRSVAEEVEFVTTYLDLEKLRFGDRFDYVIEIGEDVSQKELVPKLVLQTFAENAVKHGLMPLASGGIILIKAEKENDYLKLTIEDNGVGRKKAGEKNASTGKGIKLTAEFYSILNQINKKSITHSITDLYNDHGDANGTRVEVCVPVISEIQ
jgi:two-component sensor histidine kinase